MARPSNRARLEHLALYAGPAGIVVSVAGIALAVVLAAWVWGSWFTWTGNALSDLGRVGEPTAPLFNWSLVLSGLLGVAFAVRVGLAWTSRWHLAGAALVGVALVNAALIGVFNLPHPLHTPTAVAFFLLFTLGLFAHGSGDAVSGQPQRGVRTIWLGVAHLLGWFAWALAPFDGLALPELVGLACLGAWVVQTTLAIRRAGS